MGERILKLKLGEEYKPVIENYDRAKESHFRDIYENGIRIVRDILSDENNYSETNNELQDDYYNNIIAFVGERGMGKTSSMKSFEQLLVKNNNFFSSGFKYDGDLKYRESISKFHSMGTIDPSLFDKHNNLLEVVIAKMFEQFKNRMENDNNCINQNENNRRELIKQFSTIHENIKALYSDDKSKDECNDIDALIKKAESIKLKDNIAKLIENFLNFMGKSKDIQFLILIDDIDLNTEHAYKMAEQIRKYLIIPKVIILMAVKINQLSDAVEQNLIKSHKELLDKKRIEPQELAIMTEKYLEKLIPLERRLHLPDLNDLEINIPIEIENNKFENGMKNSNFKADTVEFGVRELIYTRTGMYFKKYEQRPNYIVPNNFRELIDLITMLYKMEPVRRTSKSICLELLQSGFRQDSKNESEYKWIEKEFNNKYLFVNDLINMEDKELEQIYKFSQLDKNIKEDAIDIDSNLKYFVEKMQEDNIKLVFLKDLFKLKQSINEIKNINNNKDLEIIRQKQLALFKTYFLKSWCKYHLKREHNEIINGFMSMTVSEKNKYIIRRLDELFKLSERDNKKNDKGNKKIRDEYEKILDHDNTSINISLGDVLFVLERGEKIATEYVEIQFIFAIKTIYSILMYEYKTEELVNSGYDLRNKIKYSRYDRLIGGSIHLSKINPILDDDLGYQDEKIIDYQKLCNKDKETLEGQFIALFIKQVGLEKNDSSYYLDQEAYYDAKKLLNNPNRALLNLFSGFLNIANVGILENSKMLEVKTLKTIRKYAENPFYFGNIEVIEDLRAYDIKNQILKNKNAKTKNTKTKNTKIKFGEYWLEYFKVLRDYTLNSSIVYISFRNSNLVKLFNEFNETKFKNILEKITTTKELIIAEMIKDIDKKESVKALFYNYKTQLDSLKIENFNIIENRISNYSSKEELIEDLENSLELKEIPNELLEKINKDIKNISLKIEKNIKKSMLVKTRIESQKLILNDRASELEKLRENSKNKAEKYRNMEIDIPYYYKDINDYNKALFDIKNSKDELIKQEITQNDKLTNTNNNIENIKNEIVELKKSKQSIAFRIDENEKFKDKILAELEEIKLQLLEKDKELETLEKNKEDEILEVKKLEKDIKQLEETNIYSEYINKNNEENFSKSKNQIKKLNDLYLKSVGIRLEKKEFNEQADKLIEIINKYNEVEETLVVSYKDKIKEKIDNIIMSLKNIIKLKKFIEYYDNEFKKFIKIDLCSKSDFNNFKNLIMKIKDEVDNYEIINEFDEFGDVISYTEKSLIDEIELRKEDVKKFEKNIQSSSDILTINRSKIHKLRKSLDETKLQLKENEIKIKENVNQTNEIKSELDIKEEKFKKIDYELNQNKLELDNKYKLFLGAQKKLEDNKDLLEQESSELKNIRTGLNSNIELFNTKQKKIYRANQSIQSLKNNILQIKEELISNQKIIYFQKSQIAEKYLMIKNLLGEQESKNQELSERVEYLLDSYRDFEASTKDKLQKELESDLKIFDENKIDFGKFRDETEQRISEIEQLEDDIELQSIEIERITQA